RIGDWHKELDEEVKNQTTKFKITNEKLKNVIKKQKCGEKELERLNIELKDKNKELEQIIFVASHDLRSPLVNIHGFTKIIGETLKSINSIINNDNVSSSVKEKLRPFLEKDLPESIDFILNSSSKLDILVSGLIKVSRLGQREINIAPLDMNKLIGTVVKTFGYQIRKDGPTLEINELPPCRGDIVQINQAFSNLSDNALKYLSPNRQGKIIISAQKKVKEVVYCVEDNGIGIDAKNKKRIFEIFLRLNPQTSTGDGLGLAIVNKIIIRHRGKVWVESEPGKGSTFFVSLPA
ncbi:MAG: ATP-binding protein, partial [Thermodesulfobacteriota bacterium]